MKNSFLYFLLIIFSFSGVEAKNKHGVNKQVIGRAEFIQIPKFQITLQARTDTGAHTCSLHIESAEIIEALEKDPGQKPKQKRVKFTTRDLSGNRTSHISDLLKISKIRNPNGSVSERYVIREKIKLGKIEKTVNINLNNRKDMKFGFLIGRNLLRGQFLVDVSKSYTQKQETE